MRSAVTKTVLPEISLLKGSERIIDYEDSYCVTVSDRSQSLTPAMAIQAMMEQMPDWIISLMKIRNSLVSVFGLKTGDVSKGKADLPEAFSVKPGSRIGPFRVISSNSGELIAGDEDKHLDFKVSFLIMPNKTDFQAKDITFTTVVWYNNFFGRLYFFLVKPFHRLIVRAALRTMASI